MTTSMHIAEESEQERIRRLRKSVEWFIAHGDTFQEVRYRAKLLTAERARLRRISRLVGIPMTRILHRMSILGTDDPLAAATDIIQTKYLDQEPA